jgi:hypothetical protein
MNISYTVSYIGKILFEPENKTKKHQAQASWKRVAMVVFEGEIAEYYAWFLKKRFNLELNKPLRGAHITFINDSIQDFNHRVGTFEEKEELWNKLKDKWDGKEITVTLNTRPFFDIKHWWLIVDHKFRDELHAIREEIGLGRPYFGLHMTIGLANEKNIAHSEYIHSLHEKRFIEINKDYIINNPLEIKRIPSDKVDLYNPDDDLIGTLFNEYELNHVRIQIAQRQLEGYYVLWRKHHRIDIESNGSIKNWPVGFFDMQENQLAELFKIQKQIRDDSSQDSKSNLD